MESDSRQDRYDIASSDLDDQPVYSHGHKSPPPKVGYLRFLLG